MIGISALRLWLQDRSVLCDFTRNCTLSRRIPFCQVFARLRTYPGWSTDDDITRGACLAARVGLGLRVVDDSGY